MKIGYPCINRSIGCTSNSSFRLASYSEQRLIDTVHSNLDCLEKILEFNSRKGLLFFRISSDIIPFASHPICKFNWQEKFRSRFTEIGNFIISNQMRVSMHPDQFTLINSPDSGVVDRSLKELEYHCQVLDEMELDNTAKIQIHIGGIYNCKPEAMNRFTNRYEALQPALQKRLVIENDDRLYSLKDCLDIHQKIGIPVVFDTLHHQCLNHEEPLKEAVISAMATWKKEDGALIVDYSYQQPNARKGKHSESIRVDSFKTFLNETNDLDFDIMLEIKDKEKSALKALPLILNSNKGLKS